jgi:AcrR family transcriptional regulator
VSAAGVAVGPRPTTGPVRDGQLTAERILDAAGRCFAERGVNATSVTDVARAAACSRPTVYRWFDDRDALLEAFVHREARRIGARVAAAVGRRGDPRRRLVDAVLVALEGVRADPTLAAWFAGDVGASTMGTAAASPVIEALVAGFLAAGPGTTTDRTAAQAVDDDLRPRARWVVRVVVSLLVLPGVDRADERAQLERFLAPVVAGGAGGLRR